MAWPHVCRPPALGGLGILDLRFFRFALRLRWAWLSRTKSDSCWIALSKRPERCVQAMAMASMSVSLGDGGSALLWTDNWCQEGPLCAFAPDLFVAISRRGRKWTVKDGFLHNRWARDIVGALTTRVLCQYLRVRMIIQRTALNPLHADRFVWKWTADGKYSTSSAYRAFFHGCTSLLGAEELWKSIAPPKVKYFFWLALHR